MPPYRRMKKDFQKRRGKTFILDKGPGSAV
jgi:hypothetical protein